MAMTKFDEVDTLAINTLRALVIDETNNAKSGHPGMALDIAPTLYVLFSKHLVANPLNSHFYNRDRFVLSSGHTSALLYALLHLAGYKLTIEDLKKFRSFGSLTPGHPEVGWTDGVDATAGPLGQGISQAVGMAIAEEAVSHYYPEGEKLCSHRTFCLCGDGDLEEGLSQEAISIAGLQKLNKLLLIYDRNGSTLDGPTSNSLAEDEKMRFLASKWNVLEVKDGNNLEEIEATLEKALAPCEAPTLIIVNTTIGYGSPLAGSHKSHGAPLGEEMGQKTKEFFHYTYPPFVVDPQVYERFKETFAKRGALAEANYKEGLEVYSQQHPDEYSTFQKSLSRDLRSMMIETPANLVSEATRKTSGHIVASLGNKIPFALGGSADVASSSMTILPNDPSFSPEHQDAHNFNFGIREFQMAGIQNGALLHGGLVTYVACFLIFSDYLKNAVRMSALEHLPAIYIFTHDSVAVGEDGPTHEPIEQLAGLRTIPDLTLIRPADAKETYAAWKIALESKNRPTVMVYSRQTLPLLTNSSEEGARKGGYLVQEDRDATIELLASGSEVSLAVAASAILAESGIKAEVVSMPSLDLFEAQDARYQEKVLHLSRHQRFALEMSDDPVWYKYAEHVYEIHSFGKSAPGSVVLDYFGFTPSKVASWVLSCLNK